MSNQQGNRVRRLGQDEGEVAFLLQPGGAAERRAEHLGAVTVPMLFLSGTRDKLAELLYAFPDATVMIRAIPAVPRCEGIAIPPSEWPNAQNGRSGKRVRITSRADS